MILQKVTKKDGGMSFHKQVLPKIGKMRFVSSNIFPNTFFSRELGYG